VFIKSPINRVYLINLAATFSSQAATAIAIILLTPLLLTQLGEAGFSLYGVVLNLIVVASVFDFSLNTTLVRRLILHPDKANESINAVFNFFLLVLFCSIPLYYFSFVLGAVHITEKKLIMALLVALIVAQNMLAVLFESVMQSVNQWKQAKLIRVLRTLIETVLLYWISGMGKIEYLFYVTGGVNLIYITALALIAKKHVDFRLGIGKLNFSLLIAHLKDSFWYFQNSIASVITFNFQIIMMSHLLTAGQMTIYLLVFRFFEIVRTGLTNFAMLLFPSITQKQKEGNWRGVLLYYKKSLFLVALITAVTMSGLFVWGYELFVYWSKIKTDTALTVYLIYCVYIALIVVDHVSGVFLSALKFNKNTAVVSSIQSLLLLMLTYILIKEFGVFGAALASLIAFVSTSLWYNPWHLWRSIQSKY